MSSIVDAPQSKPATTSTTCPICLCDVGSNVCYSRSRRYSRPIYYDEKRLLEVNQFIFPTPTDDDEDGDNSRNYDAQDVLKISNYDYNQKHIFELSACSHQFCTVCLREYIRSKLLDGVVDIPCCHFKLSNDEEDFKPCNILIEEADICNLLHKNMEDDNDNSNIDDSYWSRDCESSYNSCSSNETNTTQRNVRSNDLWTKYEQLKFDKRYGKDAVRRCPNCNEATLFDEESMKLYKAKYLTDSSAAVNTSTSAAAAADRRGINEITSAEESKLPEAEDDIAQVLTESNQSEGITKSTTPLVCCQSCNTEFCYFHSNAHSSKNGQPTTIKHCIEYHKKSLDNDRANVDYAVNTLRSKPCPSCGMAVSKEGGWKVRVSVVLS